MRGQFLKFDEAEARAWLDSELDRVFPKAEALIQKMQLDVRYKDVTFETLNREDFLNAVKAAFPQIDWEKTYQEFRAAGEKEKLTSAPCEVVRGRPPGARGAHLLLIVCISIRMAAPDARDVVHVHASTPEYVGLVAGGTTV